MKITGGCHCGKITYSATIDPMKVRICHCSDCQILSGSAFRVNLPVASTDFNLLTGNLNSYVKTAATGNKRTQCFCEHCGSQIFATSAEEGGDDAINLRVGTINERANLAPHSQQWHRSAMAWVDDIKAIVKSD